MSSRRELHPIVQQLRPSPEQVPPIQSRGKDIVVTAGAGTGKTRTLVARFLSLLAEGMPLRSIAAITFTKKAAREMRNRVREEVRKYLISDDLSRQEREAWQRVYEGLDAARISTIHSLAGEILRQHPAEMGLDPEFELLDEGESARLKGLAVEAALAWAGEDQSASGLFPLFGAWKLRRVLDQLLNNRLDVAQALDSSPENLWSHWESYLQAQLRAFVEDPVVQSGLDELAELKYSGAVERAQEAGDLLVEDLRIVIDAWEVIKAASRKQDWFQVSRNIGLLGNHLKQKGKKENWAPADPRVIIKEIQKIFNERIGKADLDLAVDENLARNVIPELRRVFQAANQWYGEAREQVNGLDFDDLEEKVLDLFHGFPDVLVYWRGEIQALLVDEYQDTNGRQRELVNLLNGGQNNLFIVGDGKQSIYRFRGADVAVFRQEQQRIGVEGESYQLETSYRSHTHLIKSLNYLLGPVLGDRADIPYLEPFAELKPGRKDPPKLDLPAYVEVHLAVGSKTAGAGDLAAEAAAARLMEIIEQDHIKKENESLNFGDVAVLCRASSSFPAFERAFEIEGIPYITVAGQGFYERPEIRDVINALQVFMDPQNDLTLAGLMRSQICGFPDEFLLDLRDFQFAAGVGSLFDAAKAFAERQDFEDRVELALFVSLVKEFSGMVGRVTAAELISRFLARTNYAAGMLLAGLDRSVGNLRKLVADAQTSGIVNLTDFLNSIQEIRNIAVREGEAQSVSEGAVQIMTVHQAKGLEFPIVILGDATKRERSSRDILIDEQFGLVPPFRVQRVEQDAFDEYSILTGKSYAYELALENERLKEEAESNRLLYVAATRAQDLLIITGAAGNPTKDQKLPSLSGWMGKLAGQMGLEDAGLEIKRDGREIHQAQIDQDGQKLGLYVYENKVEFDLSVIAAAGEGIMEEEFNLPALWDQAGKMIGSSEKAEKARAQISSPVKGRLPARVIGDVVHHALKRWKFPAGGETDFINWIEVEFKKAGIIDPQAIQSGFRRVRQILDRFNGTELYQRMEGAEIKLHEVPFSFLDRGNSLRLGSIDALFKEGGRWFLVEFKSDRIRTGSEIDWSTVDYVQQVEEYLDAAERLIDQRPAPILCFLDYGERVKLVTDRW